jgi:drug/metabolite transporter (DMT)-like permease
LKIKIGEKTATLNLLAVCAAWGTSFYIVKDLVTAVNPFTLVGYRFLVSSVIAGAIVLFMRKPLFKHIFEGFVLAFTIWIVVALQAVGLVYTTASNSGFITGLFVVFTPIVMFVFFKGRINITTFIAILVDVAGLWLLTDGLKAFNTGDFLTLLAAVGSGFHIVFIDRYGKKGLDPFVLCFQQFFFCGVLSLGTSLIMGYSFSLDIHRFGGPMIFLILVPTVFSFLVQLISQKHVTAVKAALIYTLEPVFAAGFAWTLGNEKLIPIRAAGGFLIFVGMLVAELRLPKK